LSSAEAVMVGVDANKYLLKVYRKRRYGLEKNLS
jgi:hypothetical protein